MRKQGLKFREKTAKTKKQKKQLLLPITKVFINIAVFVIIGLFLAVLTIVLVQKPMYVEKFNTTSSIKKVGYTDTVAARKFISEVNKIRQAKSNIFSSKIRLDPLTLVKKQNKRMTYLSRNTPRSLQKQQKLIIADNKTLRGETPLFTTIGDNNPPKLVLKNNLFIKLVAYVQNIFDWNNSDIYTITGEITEKANTIYITVRIGDKSATVKGSKSQLDKTIAKLAEAYYHITEPYSLAVYKYTDQRPNPKEIKNLLNICLSNKQLQDDIYSYNMLGDIAANNADFNKALSLFGRAKKINPKNSTSYYNSGIAYIRQANTQFKRESSDILKYYFSTNDTTLYANAITNFGKAIKINSDIAIYYIARGMAYFRNHNNKKAIDNFAKAVRINKYNDDSYYNLAFICFADKQYKHSLKNLNYLLKLNSTDIGGVLLRAETYHKLNQNTKAITDFRRAILLDPKNIIAYKQFADFYFAINQITNATAILEQGIELNRNDSEAYFKLGFYHFKRANYNTAISAFTRAININRRDKSSYFYRANCYHQLNRRYLAINDLSRAILIDPEFVEAYQHRYLLYEAMGNRYRAEMDKNIYDELKAVGSAD